LIICFLIYYHFFFLSWIIIYFLSLIFCYPFLLPFIPFLSLSLRFLFIYFSVLTFSHWWWREALSHGALVITI
jgi:hypothetical protein